MEEKKENRRIYKRKVKGRAKEKKKKKKRKKKKKEKRKKRYLALSMEAINIVSPFTASSTIFEYFLWTFNKASTYSSGSYANINRNMQRVHENQVENGKFKTYTHKKEK